MPVDELITISSKFAYWSYMWVCLIVFSICFSIFLIMINQGKFNTYISTPDHIYEYMLDTDVISERHNKQHKYQHNPHNQHQQHKCSKNEL